SRSQLGSIARVPWASRWPARGPWSQTRKGRRGCWYEQDFNPMDRAFLGNNYQDAPKFATVAVAMRLLVFIRLFIGRLVAAENKFGSLVKLAAVAALA